MGAVQLVLAFTLCLFLTSSLAFQSDELLIDDEEFGLEGGLPRTPSPPPTATTTSRKRFSDSGSDSKIQFDLQHAFGDSQFSDAGNFSARLKTSNHGGQTLTKLRFLRSAFNEIERKNFEKLLQEDDFYRIRLPSNVLSPPGREFIISSVKARCLTGESLEENFVIHTVIFIVIIKCAIQILEHDGICHIHSWGSRRSDSIFWKLTDRP